METLPKILNDISILLVVLVGGTVALGAFLRLAMFSQRDVSTIATVRLIVAVLCISIYFGLATRFSFRGPLSVMLSAMVAEPLQIPLLRLMVPVDKQLRQRMPYVVWLYIWATAFIGWRCGWLGLLTITLPALLIAGLGLFFVAGFLLPFPKQDLYRGKRHPPAAGGMPTFAQEIQDLLDLLRYPQNKEARKQCIEWCRKSLHCLLTYTLGTNRPYYVVIDEKMSERAGDALVWLAEEDKRIQRAEGAVFGEFLTGPGLILTGCDQAVALSTGQKFKGPKGPGVIFTGYAELPAHIVDLRVQLCAFPVEAWTKDGIAVKVTTFIPFQIGTGKGKKPVLGQGFPYRSSDVFKAIKAQLMEHVDPSQVPETMEERKWYDLPRLAGERIMREIISHYEFDELYAPFELHSDSSGKDPRSRITSELKKGLDSVLPDWGIQLIGCGIGNLEPVEKRLFEQRIEAWGTEWARKIMIQQASGQARRVRLVERARAQTQIDTILALSKRLEELRTTGGPVPLDRIVLYFVEELEEWTGKPGLRELLPEDANRIIGRARRVTGIGSQRRGRTAYGQKT